MPGGKGGYVNGSNMTAEIGFTIFAEVFVRFHHLHYTGISKQFYIFLNIAFHLNSATKLSLSRIACLFYWLGRNLVIFTPYLRLQT